MICLSQAMSINRLVACFNKVTILSDMELRKIVANPDHENRGKILLRKSNSSVDYHTETGRMDAGRSISKLQKFFGEPTPKKKSFNTIQGPQRTTSLDTSTRSNRLNKYFGERPPDELIVDQLEDFFPGLSQLKSTARDSQYSIKDIVQQNLEIQKKKRISRRSVIMFEKANSRKHISGYSTISEVSDQTSLADQSENRTSEYILPAPNGIFR